MGGERSFTEILRSREPGAAFVPLLEELAPRVEDVTLARMTTNPTLWAGAIERTAALVGADAATIGWDPSILAEACGVTLRWEGDRPVLGEPPPQPNPAAQTSGRVPAFLEAARRLSGRAGRGCIVAVPGPASLAARVLGPEAGRPKLAALKSILVGVIETICRSRPNAIALVEDVEPPFSPDLRRVYATLRNVNEHYGVATLLCVASYGDLATAAAAATSLGVDHWMVGGKDAGLAPDPAAVVGAATRFASVAVPLPVRDADRARQSAAAAVAAAHGRPAVYFTTPGPIPRDTDISLLREVGEAVRTIAH
jgi:hypothetical protein